MVTVRGRTQNQPKLSTPVGLERYWRGRPEVGAPLEIELRKACQLVQTFQIRVQSAVSVRAESLENLSGSTSDQGRATGGRPGGFRKLGLVLVLKLGLMRGLME